MEKRCKFHRAIRKYGSMNFIVETIIEITASTPESLKRKLDYIECYFIEKYNTRKLGYNTTEGGEGTVGMKLTEAHKRKISEANSGSNHPLFGKHLPLQTRMKISLAHKGKKLTPEHIAKVKQNHADFRGSKHPNFGRKWSAEVRERMSKGHLIYREVKQYDLNGNFINEYHSWTEAAKAMNVTVAAIRNCAHGKIKSCKGFIWKCEN